MKNVIAAKVNYTPSLVLNKTYYPITFSSDTTSFTIKNEGTAAAPCRLSFTPINDIMRFTVEGLSEEPIVMTRILRGNIVTIDGINRKIQIDGSDAYSQFDGWEFPKLQPGDNLITMTAANDMSLIEIEFQPRYI